MGKVWPDAFQIVRRVLWPCTRESRSGWAHSGLLRAFAARRANVSSQPEEIVITGSTAWPGQVVRGVCEAAREILLAYLALRWRSCVQRQVKHLKVESAVYWSGIGKVPSFLQWCLDFLRRKPALSIPKVPTHGERGTFF